MASIKERFSIFSKSFTFIWHHKKLLFFPFLATILTLIPYGTFSALYYHLKKENIAALFHHRHDKLSILFMLIEFLFFALIIKYMSFFLSTFSHVALSHATSSIMTNTRLSIGNSLMQSIKQYRALLSWTFLQHLRPEDASSVFGKGIILEKLIDEKWDIATFLVIPVMAHEKATFYQNLKRSEQLLTQAFGKNLVTRLVSSRLTPLLGLILTSLLLYTVILLVAYYLNGTHVKQTVITGFFLLLIGIIYTIVSAANTIFKTAVYYYTIGDYNHLGPFTAQEIRNSFVPGSNR